MGIEGGVCGTFGDRGSRAGRAQCWQAGLLPSEGGRRGACRILTLLPCPGDAARPQRTGDLGREVWFSSSTLVLITLTTTSRSEQELMGTEGRGPLKRQPFAFGGGAVLREAVGSPPVAACASWWWRPGTPSPRPWRTSAGGWKRKRDYRFAVWVLKLELLSRF